MTKQYDVVVLGSGNAGMAAAGIARAADKSVAIVESRDVGGTCPIRGCVPKKVLVAAAQTMDQIDRAPTHHIRVDGVALDWPKLMARERTFVDGVSDDFAGSLESRGIDLYEGAAHFVGPNQVAVGETTLDADKIVVATGSTPRPLPIPGAEHLITSDDISGDGRLAGLARVHRRRRHRARVGARLGARRHRSDDPGSRGAHPPRARRRRHGTSARRKRTDRHSNPDRCRG